MPTSLHPACSEQSRPSAAQPVARAFEHRQGTGSHRPSRYRDMRLQQPTTLRWPVGERLAVERRRQRQSTGRPSSPPRHGPELAWLWRPIDKIQRQRHQSLQQRSLHPLPQWRHRLGTGYQPPRPCPSCSTRRIPRHLCNQSSRRLSRSSLRKRLSPMKDAGLQASTNHRNIPCPVIRTLRASPSSNW